MVPDQQTNAPDTDYFPLGDGRIVAVLQWSRNPLLAPLGLLLWNPERMTRKEGTWLFHPELGLQRTMLTVVVDGVRHRPTHSTLDVGWNLTERPEVVARWRAGAVVVTERFYVQRSTSNLIREVSISQPEGAAAVARIEAVQIEASLYANPLLFDQFHAAPGGMLQAEGYASMSLFSAPSGNAFERFLTVSCQANAGGVCATFIYSIEAVGMAQQEEFWIQREEPDPPATFNESLGETLAGQLQCQYAIACNGLRAAVSRSGKFDASIWQYGYQWGMDAAMVATAAAISGQFVLARQVIQDMLSQLANDEGMIVESSRFRGGELSELNGNGAVLDAIWHYWRWTGDAKLLRPWWGRIRAIANYPLRPEYQHESGLLQARRDLWERLPWMGVQPGFDLSHQVFCSVGLMHIAELAQHLGQQEDAERWRAAGKRIQEAMLNHPKYRLLHEGKCIHRRLADGTPAEIMVPDAGPHDPNYAPYLPTSPETTARPCTPDAVEALPIIYGIIPASSDIATRTLDNLELLWNQNGDGGYGRSTIASDPDSPGPWAFATAFIASAEIEAGVTKRAERSLRWLLEKAGVGGTWFEYYGPRSTPPFPPVGIIVWGWAQFVILIVRHLLGVKIEGEMLIIAPKIADFQHTIRVGAGAIKIIISGTTTAVLDGEKITMEQGVIKIPLPLNINHTLIIT